MTQAEIAAAAHPRKRWRAAFGTTLHDVRASSARYRVTAAEPSFRDLSGNLIAGVTSLTTVPMELQALTRSDFQVVCLEGPSISNPYPTGWPVNISLDVEWAHAIAPAAKLVLVLVVVVGGTSPGVPSDNGPVASNWATDQRSSAKSTVSRFPPILGGFRRSGDGGESAYL